MLAWAALRDPIIVDREGQIFGDGLIPFKSVAVVLGRRRWGECQRRQRYFVADAGIVHGKRRGKNAIAADNVCLRGSSRYENPEKDGAKRRECSRHGNSYDR